MRQILSFSRRGDMPVAPVKLDSAIREVSGLLQPTMPVNISVETRLPPSLSAVHADSNGVLEALMSLGRHRAEMMRSAGGTLTFAGEDRRVTPSSESAGVPPGIYVVISVSDTGPGMDLLTLGQILEPFFAVRQREGAGLEPAMAHGILESQPGTPGSRFELYFPAMRHAAPAVDSMRSNRETGGGKHVLYVDDEDALVKLARLALPTFGYRVSAFSRPNSALEAFRQDPESFDALVTDMTMPGMTGHALAREILAMRPGLPVILLTGFIRERDKAFAREFGIKQILLKPVMPDELHAALQTHL